MKKINIVSVWNWFSNVLDTQTLNASEQLIIVHLMKILNRNYWRPTPITPSAFCRSIGKDIRTVKTALTNLINKGFVLETEFGLFINVSANQPINEDVEKAKAERTKSAETAKKNSEIAIDKQILKARNQKAPFKNKEGTTALNQNLYDSISDIEIKSMRGKTDEESRQKKAIWIQTKIQQGYDYQDILDYLTGKSEKLEKR